MEDQALWDERQPGRAPFRKVQVRDDQVFEELQKLRVEIGDVAGGLADQVAAEEQVAEQAAGDGRLHRQDVVELGGSADVVENRAGNDEIVTSVTPLQTPSGCWAVITSFSANAVPGNNLGVPYYARTDSQGGFHLKQVPTGDYRLVCWLPNYRIQRRERDPENGLVTRLVYGPPLATEQPVHVETKQNTDVTLTIDAESFGR